MNICGNCKWWINNDVNHHEDTQQGECYNEDLAIWYTGDTDERLTCMETFGCNQFSIRYATVSVPPAPPEPQKE